MIALIECDPDVCGCPAKPERRDLDAHADGGRGCKNMSILTNAHSAVAVAKSEVAGWGAFARHDIAKGELVAEYVQFHL